MEQRSVILLVGAFGAAIALAACGGQHLASTGNAPADSTEASGSADGGIAQGSGALPCDVQAVVDANCASCHGASPKYGAPMPLATTADFHAAAASDKSKKVTELVHVRIHDDDHRMPPPPKTALDTTAIATLDAWIAAGAPAGSSACTGSQGPMVPVNKPLSCTPDQHVRANARYDIKSNLANEYVCYGFDVDVSAKRHVIALGPHVDNQKLVHHMVLFQSDVAESPTPTPCEFATSTKWRMVAEWAPGGDNFELPIEAGFAEEGTTHWVMQMHYNNVQGLTGETDGSGYDLCTTDKLRANDADVMAPGSVGFTMPPHAPYDWTCAYPWGSGVGAGGPYSKVHLFNAMPHMHKLGKSLTLTKVPTTGEPELIVEQPAFDFQTQSTFPVSMDVLPGDTLRTRCLWNNTTDQPVSWGENTEDEMCFTFIAYYPKVTAPYWNWAAPSGSFSTSCEVTP